jgi:predicted acylesterase/phospholipase RssA
MLKRKFKIILFLLLFFAVLILGYNLYLKRHANMSHHNPVPTGLIYDAEIPGMPNVRLLVNPEKFEFSDTLEYMPGGKLNRSLIAYKPVVNLLVLSGGGPDGAFGAGFLSGLTDSGQRPEYDIVTGVSTGALIAPAAFIGPSYDNVLKDIYTNISDKDVLGSDIKALFLGKAPSIFNLKPLRKVLKKAITPELMNAIADEHAKGRRLYVLTTNLDARRLVVWDMGAIAVYRTQRALDLLRSVVIASSSIPAAFPPTRFKVMAGGKIYEELHVDGSIGTQMFGGVMLAEQIKGTDSKGRIFIIRNGKLWEDPGAVKPNIGDIAKTSLSMMLINQAYMDMVRMYSLSKASDIDFNCVFVPQDFHETGSGMFDPEYMAKLFDLGYSIAMSKEPWHKTPQSQSGEDQVRHEKDSPPSID